MNKLTTDHLYGFTAYLTTRSKVIKCGGSETVYDVMDCLKEYIEANKKAGKLSEDVSEDYPKTFVMPVNT